MCDVSYLCANFSLPAWAYLDLGPMYATDRQTSDRQTRQTDRRQLVRQHHR